MAVLTQPWPPDLHPSRVPFQKRTATMLQRARIWDDMTQINQLCTSDVAALDGIGPVTVNDFITTSSKAIRWHESEARELAEIGEREAWTRQVWHRDRRFADLLPPVDATAFDILVDGRHDDQRRLCRTLPDLRERIVELSAEPAEAALIRYISVNAGHDRERTVALLQRIGLLHPVISINETASRLGVSRERIRQLVFRVRGVVYRIQPPYGAPALLPQHPEAIQRILASYVARDPGWSMRDNRQRPERSL